MIEATATTVGAPQWQVWFQTAYIIMQPLIWPILLGLATIAIREMQRRGYQTTYASAIVRAVGAGVAAAQQQGLDPFSGVGRSVVITRGVEYLKQNVGEAATKLGITTESDHAERVSAQLGAMVAQNTPVPITFTREVTSTGDKQ